ncbi:hypothetical protein PENSPDRAFT_651435 [Peniophora sp. CONT]|nr:hypothetical protein PENSPDRAFT_651435 [Peniophora sp. CONT]
MHPCTRTSLDAATLVGWYSNRTSAEGREGGSNGHPQVATKNKDPSGRSHGPPEPFSSRINGLCKGTP